MRKFYKKIIDPNERPGPVTVCYPEPREFLTENFGLVKVSSTVASAEMLILNLDTPLAVTLPFMPEPINVDALQLDKGDPRVRILLFEIPLKVPYTLSAGTEKQQLEFSVKMISLVYRKTDVFSYLLDLSCPADLGNNNFVCRVLINANGNVLKSWPAK